MFHFIGQIEEIIEPYRHNIADLCAIEVLKNVLRGYRAAYFCGANLQLSLKTMQQSSSYLQCVVTLLKQVFTINLPSEIQHSRYLKMRNFFYKVT